MTTPTASGAAAPAALRRAVRLEHLTVAWNVLEVFVTITLGVVAGSLALIGFGLDSLVEIFASVVVLWHLRGTGGREQTQRALWLVALAFFALAAVLAAGAIRDLVGGNRADASPLGIVYLGMTAVVMLLLARAKRRSSVALGNHPLAHEARVTLLDSGLAVGILVALAANAVLDWWWADPVSALAIAGIAVSEGIAAPKEH